MHPELQIMHLPRGIELFPLHLILHEVAHCFAPQTDPTAATHDVVWEKVYLRLIGNELGRLAAERMKSALQAARGRSSSK